jgi:signal transduction histidine kinase/ligand-binding sensor domain-containing protein
MRAWQSLLFAFQLTVSAYAATPPPAITDYALTSFSPAQGAPSPIGAIQQTSDGFLWLSSPLGLYRFDGIQFERVQKFGNVPLLGTPTDILATHSGGLWIGYWFGGASYLDAAKTLRNYRAEPGGLPLGTVESFAQDDHGTVWAATSRGLARFDGQRWTEMTDRLGLPSQNTSFIEFDASNNLWIHTGPKIALLRSGSSRAQVYDLPSDSKLQRDAQGRVWGFVRDSMCLYLLDAVSDAKPACHRLPADVEQLHMIDETGHVWFTGAGNRLGRVSIPPSEDPNAIRRPGLSQTGYRYVLLGDGGQANDVLEDREGNLWFATSSGLSQLRIAAFKRLGPFPEYVVVDAGAGNSIWVGTTHGDPARGEVDFFRLQGDSMVPQGGGPTSLTASYRDADGVLWMGGNGRLWKLQDNSWQEIVAPGSDITLAVGDPYRRIQAIYVDAHKDLWVSMMRHGLFRRHDGKWERLEIPGLSETDYPFTICADDVGVLWFGYAGARLASLKEGSWRTYTERDGISVGNIFVLGDVNHQLWIGGDRGLERIRGGRFEPLPSVVGPTTVAGVLQAKNGDLWLNSNVGGLHITREELQRLDANPAATLAIEKFDVRDGLPGIPVPPRPNHTVFESDDGRIWFVAMDRFSYIEPQNRRRNTVPPTVIVKSVTADGHPFDSSSAVALNPNPRNLEIEYTATSLTIPSRVHFRYRLEGLDNDWQDVGPRRAAYYTNLPPGHYQFHVIAANDEGVWNLQGRSLALTVPALFYQTLWFRIAVVAFVILVVSALAMGRFRIATERERKRLEQRMEDRLKERSRIARELHDSLLQGFHGLMFRLQAVRQLLPERPVTAAETLDTALKHGDRALDEGRQAVQALRASVLADLDLAASIGSLGADLESGSVATPTYRVVVLGKPRALPVAVRDNAYQIVREAVRNAFRHADAKEVRVELHFEDSNLRVRVEDDGIGMQSEVLAHGQRLGHWGMPGMRERAESIGGGLSIKRRDNAGTEVELSIPAKTAYVDARSQIATN